jgi:hypothetical protein
MITYDVWCMLRCEYRQVHAQLERESTESEQGRKALVEACRQMAELMIWGDKHDERFFEYFADCRVLESFVSLLSSTNGRRAPLASQLLQTLSIMLQNIKQQTSIYFLLSNAHINNLIQLELDFSDEEVLAYYISLLKTLSLTLTHSTINFFFQPAPDPLPPEHGSFPLFTQAIRFANHSESMVRAAVRTLTLNVFSVPDSAVRQFVLSFRNAPFLDSIVHALREQTYALDHCFCSLDRQTHNHENVQSSTPQHIDSAVAELGDLLCYCSDALQLDFPQLRSTLASRLWSSFFEPLVFPAIASATDDIKKSGDSCAHDIPPRPSRSSVALDTSIAGDGHDCTYHNSSKSEVSPPASEQPYNKQSSNERAEKAAEAESSKPSGQATIGRYSEKANGQTCGNNDRPESNSNCADNYLYKPASSSPCGATAGLYVLSRAFLSLRDKDMVNALAAALVSTDQREPAEYMQHVLRSSSADELIDDVVRSPAPTDEGLNPHWDGLLHCAEGGHDGMTFAAACTVIALVKSREVEDELLKKGGILPSRHHRISSAGIDTDIPAYRSHEVQLTDVQVSRSGGAHGSWKGWSTTTSGGREEGASTSFGGRWRKWVRGEQGQRVDQREALTSALLSYLRRHTVIAQAIWTVGWVLRTLMPQEANMGNVEYAALTTAVTEVTQLMESHLMGPWADAALPLIEDEWTSARQALQIPSLNDEVVAESIYHESMKRSSENTSGSAANELQDEAFHLVACCRSLMTLHMIVPSLKGLDMAHKPPIDAEVATEAGSGKHPPFEGSKLVDEPVEACDCKVAFERGHERSVQLVQLMTGVDGCESAVVNSLLLMEDGIVRSVTPACGSNAEVDSKQNRWLHVQVRAPARALIEYARSPTSKQMRAGRWTLAFDNATACANAKVFSQGAAKTAHSVLRRVVQPLMDLQM